MSFFGDLMHYVDIVCNKLSFINNGTKHYFSLISLREKSSIYRVASFKSLGYNNNNNTFSIPHSHFNSIIPNVHNGALYSDNVKGMSVKLIVVLAPRDSSLTNSNLTFEEIIKIP